MVFIYSLTQKLHGCEFKFQQAFNRSLFYLTAQYLENQIRERDGVSVGTHNVVKNLEMNQVVGVTDLRGRVVRCDTSIARLAADMKTAFDSIRNLGQQQLEQNSRMVESVHALNTHVSIYIFKGFPLLLFRKALHGQLKIALVYSFL